MQIAISKRSAFMIVLAFLLVVPAVAFGTDVFDDVSDTSVHTDGIGFGCDATNYCPSDNVTRAQMGTFLYRLSGNDPATPPSVDADKVDGLNSTDLQTAAYSSFNDGPIVTSSGDREVIRLDVPAGSYVIMAKAWLDHNSGVELTAECTLSTGFDFDQSRVGLAANSSLMDTASVSMTVVRNFGGAGTVILSCDELAFNANLSVYDAKITAIQVDSLSNVGG